jgi:AbiJ N-terminal domain 4
MKFSQRIGLTPASKLVQRESIDEELKNSLWSALTFIYWDTFRGPDDKYYDPTNETRGSNLWPMVFSMWLLHFKKPVDTIDEYSDKCLARLRSYFYKAEWYEVFDFMEFCAEHGPDGSRDMFEKSCNSFLERENSAYRFVEGKLAEITSQAEIEAVEDAIAGAAAYPGVSLHLRSALQHLSNRSHPDYRNSIKESISAVESLAKHVSGEEQATLGQALKQLEKSHSLHPALKSAFTSLYGFTSDSNGIRHALMEHPALTKADARFMLVCCSAFTNYVIDATIKR